MELEVLNLEKILTRKLKVDIFDIKNIRHDLIHQLIVWQLAKKRKIISHTKEISEVRGSTRKIYKQKGTGRARHGSIRAPQFRGGGIIFGPHKDRKFNYKINKKVKKFALLNALALKFKNRSIIIYNYFKIKDSKIKTFLNMYGCSNSSKKILFIDNNFSENFVKSIKNIYNVDRLLSGGINVLDIIKHDKIYLSEEALKSIIERLK